MLEGVSNEHRNNRDQAERCGNGEMPRSTQLPPEVEIIDQLNATGVAGRKRSSITARHP